MGCRFPTVCGVVAWACQRPDTQRAGNGWIPRKRVTVVDYPDGRLSIRHQGVELTYRTFDKIQQVDQGAIANNKRLGPLLAMIREQQLRREPQHRSQRAPRRRDQRDARLFKVG